MIVEEMSVDKLLSLFRKVYDEREYHIVLYGNGAGYIENHNFTCESRFLFFDLDELYSHLYKKDCPKALPMDLDDIRKSHHTKEDSLTAAESSLAKLWDTPEEDEAWKDL